MKLSGKVTLAISALVFILSLASTTFLFITYQNGVMAEMRARGTTMADALARGVAEGIASENLGIIKQVQSIVQTRDVILAQVYSSVWLPIDSYPSDNFNLVPNPRAMARLNQHADDCFIQERDAVDFYAPVYYHHLEQPAGPKYIIGYVRIKLSTRPVNSVIINHIIIYFLGSLAFTILVLIALRALIHQFLLDPIERLNRAIARAVDRDAFQPVPVTSSDEIGQLSSQFNRLFAAIQERERNVRLSEEKFSTVFRLSPDALAIAHFEDGRFTEINEGFAALFGYRTEEILGRTSHELNLWTNPEDRSGLLAELNAHGVVHNLEVLFRPREGPLRTCCLSARLIEIKGRLCILSVVRELTQRELAEEWLRGTSG